MRPTCCLGARPELVMVCLIVPGESAATETRAAAAAANTTPRASATAIAVFTFLEK